jgi:hypothetical protein
MIRILLLPVAPINCIRTDICVNAIFQVCFICGKCLQKTWTTFEDGVFDPPDECRTDKLVI